MDSLGFGEPQILWLLVAPAVLFGAWIWRLVRHARDRRAFRRHRRVPIRERLPVFGGLLFWLGLIGALACTVVAMARPTAAVPLVRSAGADVVILQDGSASMHVRDVRGDRWQRSIQFLRTLGESLRWKEDRVALALFAHVAEPQIRLTRDPNTYFFFLDHLRLESPFRLEDDSTWDTNIELGMYWGMRLIEKDQQLHGGSPNAKVFVLVSDGQAWSGSVARSIKLARDQAIPVFVVGVGTVTGGMIPEPARRTTGPIGPGPTKPIHSSLDRESLGLIAAAGDGQYLELDREGDREIANRIIDAARRRGGSAGMESTARDLYWQFLLAAACLIAIGVLFMQERVELWLFTLGTGAALAIVWTVTR
jgi:von Willebrand factor type A domain-containing protein